MHLALMIESIDHDVIYAEALRFVTETDQLIPDRIVFRMGGKGLFRAVEGVVLESLGVFGSTA